MTLTITIDTTGAAFEPDPAVEVARVISFLAGAMQRGVSLTDAVLVDKCGNRCGTVVLHDTQTRPPGW